MTKIKLDGVLIFMLTGVLLFLSGCATSTTFHKGMTLSKKRGLVMMRVNALVFDGAAGKTYPWPCGINDIEYGRIYIAGHTKKGKSIGDYYFTSGSIPNIGGGCGGWFLKTIPAGEYSVTSFSYSFGDQLSGGRDKYINMSVPFNVEEGKLNYIDTIIVDFGQKHIKSASWDSLTITTKNEWEDAKTLLDKSFGENFLKKYPMRRGNIE